jgi:hypothetical protein
LGISCAWGRVSEGSKLTRAAHFGRLVANRVSRRPHLNGELPERCFAGPDFLHTLNGNRWLSRHSYQGAVVSSTPAEQNGAVAMALAFMVGDECMVDDVPEAGAKLRSRLGFSDR